MHEVKNKNEYWQAVRGICILAIVLIHCGVAIDKPFTSIDGTYYLIVRSVYSFAVSTLFFLAGKFTKISSDEVKGYFIKRFKRLLIPYLVWSAIYLLFGIVRGVRYSVSQLIVCLLTGGAAIPFYYTIVLLYFTLLTPFLIKLIRKKLLHVCIGCTVVLVISGYFAQFYTGDAGWVKLTPIWLAFYVAGLMQGMGLLNVRTPKRQACAIWIVAYIIQVIESIALLNLDRLSEIAYSQWHIGAYLYAVATINLLLTIEKTDEHLSKTWLVKIGDNSYGIYLIHCLFLSIMVAVMNRIPFSIPLQILRILQFGISVGGSLVAIAVIKIIFRKYSKKLFGL